MADYTLTAKLTADARNLIQGFNEASEAVQNTGQKIQDTSKKIGAVGAKMSIGVTAPLVAMGKAVIGTGMNFDDSMAKVAAVSGATGDDLMRLRDTAKEMGATTRYSASEAADGLNFMAMAGWNTEQMVSGLPGVLSLAAASGADLATTSDIVTDALTAFGLQAKDSGKFADILAATSSKANTDVVMLGESFKYVAPLAGAMKYRAEDVSVALGLMANAGIKGSQAGTSLKTMLANLASPTKAMSTAMDDLGISLTNSDGSMKTLDEVMGDLRTSFGDLDEVQQAQYASTLFGKEAMAGSLSIINASAADYDKLTEAINNADGSAATMAETMENTLGGQLRSIQSATEGVAIQFYEEMLPALQAVADKVQSAIGFIAGMSGESKRLSLVVALIAAAIGPVLIGLSMFGFLIGGVVTAIGFLVSPVGLVIAGILALAATLGVAMARSETFRNQMTTMFNGALDSIKNFIETARVMVESMYDVVFGSQSIKDNADLLASLGFSPGIATKLMTITSEIGAIMTSFWDILFGSQSVKDNVDFMQMMGISEDLASRIGAIAGAIQTTVSGLFAAIGSFAENFQGHMSTAFTGLMTTLSTVFGLVKTVVLTVIDVIGQFVMSIVGGFTDAGGSIQNLGALFLMFNPILKIAMMVLTQFGPQIAAGFMEIASLVVPILTTLGTMLGQLAAAVIPLVMNVIQTLIPVVVMLATAILNIITAVLPVLLNIFMQLVPVVMSLVTTIIGLVTQLVPLVTTIIGALVPVLMMLIDVILNIVQAVAPALIAIIGAIIAIFQAIIPVVMSILTVVIHVFAMIIATLTPIIAFVAGLITSIISIIAPIVTFIAGIIASIFKVITPIIAFVNGVFQTVFTIISGIWQSIMQAIGAAIQSISNTISQVSGVVSGVFNGIWSKIATVMDRVKNKIQGVFDSIKTAWTGLKTFVSTIFTGIGDNMQDLVNRVKGFVNGVIGGINSAVSLINKIPGVSISKIPYLARGTDDWQGGFARINEGGRGELVNLPNGAQVIPHDISMKYAREAGQANARGSGSSERTSVIREGDVNIHIAKFENHTDRDLETLSHDLGWMTQRERSRLSND